MSRPRAPIIVIGMHRSGTSMLGELLTDHGFFPGRRLQSDGHHEAIFFQHLNRWILGQASAGWDDPEGVRALIDEPTVRSLIVDYLDLSLRSPRAIEFLGVRRYLRHRSVQGLSEPWGWKDPRSTFTLPFWLDLFPDAKVVHIVRHGVDVANSLVVRRRRELEAAERRYRGVRLTYLVRPRRSGFLVGPQVDSLDAGLDLWDRYVCEAERHVSLLGDRAMELRFEDLLEDPETSLKRVAEFAGLSMATRSGRPPGAGVQPSRASAYRDDDQLAELAARRASTLAVHGYHP